MLTATLSKEILDFSGIVNLEIHNLNEVTIIIADLGQLTILPLQMNCKKDKRDDNCLIISGQTNKASFLEKNTSCSFSGLIYFRKKDKGYLMIRRNL